MHTIKWSTVVIFLTGFSQIATAIDVDERIIAQLARQNSVNAHSIEATRWDKKVSLESFKDTYQAHAFTEATHTDSSEKSIANFVPQFGPTDSISLGVKKITRYGTSYALSAYTNQQSSVDDVIKNATRTGVSLAVDVDLWKDLFGRSSRLNLKNHELADQKSDLETKLQLKNHEIEIRKLFWSIVANVESQKITKRLMKSAENQLKIAQRKKINSVSDAGDVARSQAQLATRKGTLLLLNYQKELLIKTLKYQIPQLQGTPFVLKPIDLDQTVSKVLQCTHLIKSYSKIPWKNTPIDDLLEIIKDNNIQKEKLNELYSDIDFKLSTELHMSGVNNGYSESYDDLTANGRNGYSIGFKLSIPLGSQKSDTKSFKNLLQAKKFLAEKQTYLRRVSSEHEQISPLIFLLENAARTQKINSHNLQLSLASMNKKYRQARVDVSSLINDQDALMQSLLTEIATQLSIIHNLLDYFKTFTETPCAINKLG